MVVIQILIFAQKKTTHNNPNTRFQFHKRSNILKTANKRLIFFHQSDFSFRNSCSLDVGSPPFQIWKHNVFSYEITRKSSAFSYSLVSSRSSYHTAVQSVSEILTFIHNLLFAIGYRHNDISNGRHLPRHPITCLITTLFASDWNVCKFRIWRGTSSCRRVYVCTCKGRPPP